MRRSELRLPLAAIVTICGFIAAANVFAQTPATQSAATKPSSDAAMRPLFLQLSDPDPRLRDKAKTDLMGFTTADLPALRQIAADNAPLAPQVISALHEIVLQVFLASYPYASTSGAQSDASGNEGPYFLGILWQSQSDEVRLGAWVDERLPGFPSYRFLRTGDMIMGILKDPSVPLEQLPNLEIHNIENLKNDILAMKEQQNIALQVLRDGEVIQISVRMAPRPQIASTDVQAQNMPMVNNAKIIEDFAAVRATHGEEYWHQNFDAIADPQSDTAASNP